MKACAVKNFLTTLSSLVLACAMNSVCAQDAKEKLVELANPTIQAQTTPDFKGTGVKDKRWKPKEWLEFEIPFMASAPKSAKGKFDSFDQLVFKYYLFLDHADKEKKKVLTAEVTHVNVPVGEATASVVYLSPAAVHSLTGSSRVAPNAVTFWGVEVTYQGKLVGFASSNKSDKPESPWWKASSAPPQVTDVLKTKSQTPFAPLWGDYHADTQPK